MSHIEVWYADPKTFGALAEPGWYFDTPRNCIGPYQDREEAESARNCFYQNMSYFMNGPRHDSYSYLPG